MEGTFGMGPGGSPREVSQSEVWKISASYQLGYLLKTWILGLHPVSNKLVFG